MDHQRINGTSFVFSAAVPALLAVSSSEGINILQNMPSILSTLQEDVCTIRAVLDRIDAVTIPSHAASPIIHIQLHSATPSASISTKPVNTTTPAPCDALSFDIVGEERLLQDIVDEVLAQGVWIARAGTYRGAPEYPPRCHGGAVTQGMRARRRGRQGCRREGARQAEMIAPAAPAPISSSHIPLSLPYFPPLQSIRAHSTRLDANIPITVMHACS